VVDLRIDAVVVDLRIDAVVVDLRIDAVRAREIFLRLISPCFH